MKIAKLISLRADYGIYMPILKKLEADSSFSLEVIAFGTQISREHGYTLDKTEQDNYPTIHKELSLVAKDVIIKLIK